MRAQVTALTWEICLRNRNWAVLVAGMTLAGWISTAMFGAEDRTLSGTLMTMSFLFVFGIFNYTEIDPQRGTTGFPPRLYALPVSSLLLVTVPVVSGIASLLVLRFAWIVFGGFEVNALITAKLIAFMVLYQSILWVLARFGVMRIIILGVVAVALIFFGFLQNREAFLTALLWIAGATVIAKFCLSVLAWRRVAAKQFWRYMPVWSCGTCCLIALAMLLWSGLRSLLPPDADRLRDVLILVALSIMPMARLGLAPLALARNRHR